MPTTTIQSLPPELLSVIFEETCRDGSFEQVLSHVDSTWRFVALATPKLWCQIQISRDQSLSKVVAIEYIKRSKNELLYGQFRGRMDEYVFLAELLREVVLPNAQRWKSLFIQSVDPNLVQLLNACPGGNSHACEGHFPNLQRLSIEAHRHTRIGDQILPCGAPRLRSLHIDNLQKCAWPSLAATLVSLHLDQDAGPTEFHGTAHFLKALKASTHLENLVIHGDFISSFSPGEYETVHLAKLNSLDVSGMSSTVTGFLLSCFSTPVLYRLTIRPRHQTPRLLTSSTGLWSIPSVQSLIVECNGKGGAEDWETLQQLFPNVVQLITAPEFSWWDSPADSWPQLHTLAFKDILYTADNLKKWGQFKQWLRHRNQIGLPIAQLRWPLETASSFAFWLNDSEITSLIEVDIWYAEGELPMRRFGSCHNNWVED